MHPEMYDAKAAYDAPRDTNPDSFVNVAEQANNRLGDFMHRLAGIVDTLCGPLPPMNEATGQGSIRSVPNGHFDSATDNCRQMLTKIEQAHKLLQRIEAKL